MHARSGMKIGDAMNRNVLRIDAEDALSTALQLMLWAGIRHLPVMQEGRLVGLLSERDILRYQAEHGGRDALSHPVARAASMPAKFAHPEDPLDEAIARMGADKIGALPVLVEGDLVGLVTVTDVLSHQALGPPDGVDAPHARDIMSKNPVTVRPADPLSVAVERMVANEIRHLPVVDGEGRMCGILSDRDIRPLTTMRALEQTRVEDVMSRSVISLGPDAGRGQLVEAFTRWHLSAVPIVDADERPLGMVSYLDLLRALA